MDCQDIGNSGFPRLDPSLIPPGIQKQFDFTMLRILKRIRTEDPDTWEKIERRAAEIRKEREKGISSI